MSKNPFNQHPVEQDADVRGFQNFYNKTGGNFTWDFYSNPIGQYGYGTSMSVYNTSDFQNLLHSSKLPIIGGIS